MTSASNPEAEVIVAIIKTALAVPSLAKSERNDHGDYNYVSIDRFYDEVAREAMKNGLTWKAREISGGTVATPKGPASAYMASYEFDLMHANGFIWANFFSISIMHPLQGAQTAGSAMSYAEKQFMREVFKVRTGEQDADATDSRAFDGQLKIEIEPTARLHPNVVEEGRLTLRNDGPAVAKLTGRGEVVQLAPKQPEKKALDVQQLIEAFLPLAKTEEELTEYWVGNAALLEEEKRLNPEGYKHIKAAFAARKKEIAS